MNNAKALRTEGESSKCHTISILVETNSAHSTGSQACLPPRDTTSIA